MVDKNFLDITDELFQDTEEIKGNNEIKLNFFSPKKSNTLPGNQANYSPISSVDELGGNENPVIVTQLLKTQQELGLTKIGILEFQNILTKELQKLHPSESRFAIVNNQTMTNSLIQALNKYRNPGADKIDENLVQKNIYSYLLLKQPAATQRMTRAATFGRESDENYEIDASPKKESLNLSKEQFIWILPNANSIETASKQDLLKSIVDAITKNANSDASQKNFLIEKYGQYAYSHLLSLATNEFKKPAELANDLNNIIQKAKKSGNIANLSEFILSEIEEEYEILQSEAPKKTSLKDKRKEQKLIKFVKPSGVEGEAIRNEEINEEFEIKHNLENEIQKPEETKTEDVDQKYKEIIENLKAKVKDLEANIDEEKTTIFFLNQEITTNKESIKNLIEEVAAIKKHYDKIIYEQEEKYKKLENNWKLDEEAIKVLNQGLRQLSEEKSKLETELKNKEKSLTEQLSQRLTKLNYEKIEYEEKIKELERDLQESNLSRNQYQEETLRNKIEIDTLNRQINDFGVEIIKIGKSYEETINEKNRLIRNYQKSIENVDIEENKKLNETIKQQQAEIYSLKHSLVKNRHLTPESFESLSKELNSVKSENAQLKSNLKYGTAFIAFLIAGVLMKLIF